MKTQVIVKLDKQEVIDKMWNGCNGSHVLAVAPDGSDHRIHWMESNRQWDPWPDGWLIIGIPALDPDGSGQELQDAADLLNDLGLTEQASTIIEAEDIGWPEVVERLAADDWKANRENGYDWLADAFLSACNGEGSELNAPSPWGYEYDEDGSPSDIDPPAEFEWAKHTISITELSNTWGCAWEDSEDKTHYGFDDCPVSHRAQLWLNCASGDAVNLLIKAKNAAIVKSRQGAYGGEKRTVEVDVDKLNAACDRYWDRVNAAGQEQDEAGCHYCGQPAVDVGFFGEPVCSECG